MKKTDVIFLNDACSGKLLGNQSAVICDVKIDSREAASGDMFVCIAGENNDGHDFAGSAYDNGCRVFLMSDESVSSDMISMHDDATVILVENTVKALEKMAKAYLSKLNVHRIGVTGSVGKTTTKKLCAAVLSQKFNTVCTKKNLNTDIGLCLTAFIADDDTEAIVFEMGMDDKGQIKEYVSFIEPEAAVITNIGVSHMERLGSRDAIADAKLEIVSEFKDNNVLIVNAESDYLQSEEEIRDRAINKSNYKIVLCGKDIVLSDVESLGENGVDFVIKTEKESAQFHIPLIGAHNAVDAFLAAALGLEFGISLSEAAVGIKNVESTDRRLNVEKINGITLIDDSYNASPDSMKAGLAALSGFSGRKIAVLGDMYELGDAEESGHIEVGKAAADNGVNYLIAVGMNRRLYGYGVGLSNTAVCNVIELENKESAMEFIKNFVKDGDVVLVKGSNSTKISEVANYIRNMENE